MPPDETRPAADAGTAGASAAREHDRRKTARVRKTLMHHPFANKDDVAQREGPAHERAFADGSAGEQWVARVLAKRLRPGATALHDRAIAGRRGNIDHIVVASSGVWVVDAKRYSGKLCVWHAPSGPGMLTIGGRDKTALIDGLARQVASVEAVVVELAPRAPVHGALCFVDTVLPRGRLELAGWHVLDAEQLARRINIATARLEPETVRVMGEALAARFPPA